MEESKKGTLLIIAVSILVFALLYNMTKEDPPEKKPFATLEENPPYIEVGESLNISANGSYSKDNDYYWVIGNLYQKRTTVPWLVFTFEDTGKYDIELKVDNKATTTRTIIVKKTTLFTGSIKIGDPNDQHHFELNNDISTMFISITHNKTTDGEENELSIYVYNRTKELKNTTEQIRKDEDPQVHMLTFSKSKHGPYRIIVEYSAGSSAIQYIIKVEQFK